MTAVALCLLAGGVLGAVGHLRRRALAVVPMALAGVSVAVGVVDASTARDAMEMLTEPLAFLLLAVPLAVLLDRAGCFDAVARRLPARWVAPGLWVFGAATVALVNLDAAVVLLTPVAVTAAARSGDSPKGLALQPALLACLASSWLPVSNLTNLIAEEHHERGAWAFLQNLGPPSLAALGVGYACWRLWWPRPDNSGPYVVTSGELGTDDSAALRLAAVVGTVLLVGFTLGSTLGLAPWVVAGFTVVSLSVTQRHWPWSAVPWPSAMVAAGLAVLAVGAAAHVDVAGWMGDGDGPGAILRLVGVGALAANVTNNLPAMVAGLPHVPEGGAAIWAWLLGVNAGPTVLVTGSLSGLLWIDVARRSGLTVTWRDYAAAGLRVGLPALSAAALVLAVLA